MRLKPEKVAYLCQKIFDVLKADADCQFIRDDQMVQDEIRANFLHDLQREDKIDEEIRDKLDAHMDQIANRSVSRTELAQRAKKMLARERDLIF